MTDKELFKKYLEGVGSIKDRRYLLMNKEMFQGQTSYLRMKFKGSSIFNPEWIRRIEDCMYELDQITNNPREVTTVEGSIVPIELAKKVNYESVQHLASHSQFIKEVKDNGDVVPAKILGLYNKEELHTYENRFIATFIRKLTLFIDKRYEFIKKTVNLDEKEVMYVRNNSVVDGQDVEIETKITVRRPSQDDLSIAARDYIARIDKLKEYVGYYYNSPFMKEFKTEKNVRRPIILTNILRKNPLYHKCYETYLFIEKFDSLGVAFKVDRDFQEFNEKERKHLSHILLSNILFLENTENNGIYKTSNKVYKPKLLDSIDDEVFLYDDLVKGPIDYVRADDAYIHYLKNKGGIPLPEHPNKAERKYYGYEYVIRRNYNKEAESIDSLLGRIRRDIERYEKRVEELLAERKEEDAKALNDYLEDLRDQEADILRKKRQEIIDAAKLANPEDLTPKKEEKKEENNAKPEQIVEKLPDYDDNDPQKVWHEIDPDRLMETPEVTPEDPNVNLVVTIPGHGYYVSETKGSIFRKDAYIFHDEKLAKKIAKKVGGKVEQL